MLSHFLENLLIAKAIYQLAEYKFSDFIYRRVPGIAWNISRETYSRLALSRSEK